MIHLKRLLMTSLVGIPLLAGCTSNQPEPEPVVQQPDPVNQEVLKALSDLSEIKQELKKLRNSVEELQFESENAKRRQQDLFQDLDRRLVDIERNQTALDSGAQVVDGTQTEAGQAGVVVVGDTTTQSGQADDETATDGQSANQVIVVSSENQSATTSAQGGQSTAVASVATGSVTLEEQEAYEQAFELLKQSRYEDAVAGFQQFADTWPNSQLADDAYYWMSEARYVNREFEEALRGFRTVVSRYPDSQRVPEALLKIGYIQYDIGSYEDAAGTFRDILDRFPGHQVTVSAQTRLRRIEQTIQ